jgi:addiction module HigA family antidote
LLIITVKEIMVRVPTHRQPTHPGIILLEEFLEPMAMSQTELAKAINVPYQRVNDLINGRRGITPGTALRLAKFFGTTPDFWLNFQRRWELYRAQQKEGQEIEQITPCH